MCRHVARSVERRGSSRPPRSIAFYLPMHTATRLAAPLHRRASRASNPGATVAAYGLYAPLNAAWLRERGVTHVLGPEAEADLVALAGRPTPSLRQGFDSQAAQASRTSGVDPEAAVDSARSLVAAAAARGMRRCRCRTARAASSATPRRRAAASTCAGIARSCRCTAARSVPCRSTSCWTTCGRRSPPALSTSRSAIPTSSTARRTRGGSSSGSRAECRGVTYDVTIKIEHLLKHVGPAAAAARHRLSVRDERGRVG